MRPGRISAGGIYRFLQYSVRCDMSSPIQRDIWYHLLMNQLKHTLGVIVAWLGFATLLLGPVAALMSQSVGPLAVCSAIWLFILTTNYVFWDRFRILPWN